MARKALLVASNEFRDDAFENLSYPLSDAERLAAVLRDPDLCFFDEVQILTNATLDGARRAIFSVTGKAARDDLILLYFSGHGSLDKDGSLALVLPETESDLLAATSLIADDLKRAFNLSRASQKVLILDCCYAGAMGPDKMKSSASDSVAALAEAASGTFILTASTKFQPAFERAELGGSVLTSCLVDGIAKGQAAPGAETVTLSALAAFVKAQAPTHGAQQPQFWDLGSTGELVFARRPLTFDEAWRAQVSQLVAQHHVDGHIEYEMQEQIYAVIRAPTTAANRAAKELIEQLRRRKIGLARFGSAWNDLYEAMTAPAPLPVPPSPAAIVVPEPPPASKPAVAGPSITSGMPLGDVDVASSPTTAKTSDIGSAPPSGGDAPPGLRRLQPELTPSHEIGTLWGRLKGDGLGAGPERYGAPLLATIVAIGVSLMLLKMNEHDGALIGTSIVLGCLMTLWLHLRLSSAPGASGALKTVAALLALAVALLAGFLSILLLGESGPDKIWSPVFAVPTVLALGLLGRMFAPPGPRAGRRPS